MSTTTEHYPHHCTHNDNRASRLSHNPRNQEALMSDLTKRGRGPKEEDMNPKRGARFVGFSKKRVADKTRGIWHHHSHIITLGLLWSGCVKPFKKNGRRMHWYFSIVKHKVTPNLILNDSDFLQAKFFLSSAIGKEISVTMFLWFNIF